jgi:hypothetical protein
MRDIPREIDGAHRTLTQLSIDEITITERRAKFDIGYGPGRDLRLEECFKRHSQHFHQPLARPRARIRMFAVDDVRPMPARKSQLERPVILAEPACCNELLELFYAKSVAHE